MEIVAYKHDGSFHRTYKNLQVLNENENEVILGSKHLVVFEHDGRIWDVKFPLVFLLCKKEFYNVLYTYKSSGIHIYCNIASPSIYDPSDNDYKFIDYDYDVKVTDNITKGLDKNDFKKNRLLYNYNDKLVLVIENTYKSLMQKAKKGETPFCASDMKNYFVKLMDR